jgi:hypothetical protein
MIRDFNKVNLFGDDIQGSKYFSKGLRRHIPFELCAMLKDADAKVKS